MLGACVGEATMLLELSRERGDVGMIAWKVVASWLWMLKLVMLASTAEDEDWVETGTITTVG